MGGSRSDVRGDAENYGKASLREVYGHSRPNNFRPRAAAAGCGSRILVPEARRIVAGDLYIYVDTYFEGLHRDREHDKRLPNASVAQRTRGPAVALLASNFYCRIRL